LLARQRAEQEMASLYRVRVIARANAAERRRLNVAEVS